MVPDAAFRHARAVDHGGGFGHATLLLLGAAASCTSRRSLYRCAGEAPTLLGLGRRIRVHADLATLAGCDRGERNGRVRRGLVSDWSRKIHRPLVSTVFRTRRVV